MDFDGLNVGRCINVQPYEAPTGRKEIAQGKAQRRPGIRYAINTASPEGAKYHRAESNVHRTRRASTPRVALRSTLGYFMMPRWGNAIERLLNEFRLFEYSPRY